METQTTKRIPSSVRTRMSDGSEQNFLLFTRQLNQYQNAEHLMQALPSLLHGLISANTFMIVQMNASHSTSSFVVDSKSRESSPLTNQASDEQSAYSWVHERQEPLVIRSIVEETNFRDTLQWFRSNGDRSICILPLSTAIHRLGVIGVGRSSENAFSEEEVSLLALASDHAALALDDRLNFAALEKASQQLENERTKLKLILDLTNSVVSNLELKQLIQAISPSIRKAMQLDAVALMLPTIDDGNLEVYALDFPDSKGIIHPGAIVSPEGPPGKVFRTGK
jgi:formate hydrogenlyase transcriptional activator